MSIADGLRSLVGKTEAFIGNNPAASIGIASAGGALVGASAVAIAKRKKRTRRAPAKRRSTARKPRKRARTRAKPRKRARPRAKRKVKYARTAGKRRDTSTRRIRMTKNGQPYIIMASGKARFISKASARASRSRKGGRY